MRQKRNFFVFYKFESKYKILQLPYYVREGDRENVSRQIFLFILIFPSSGSKNVIC